MDDDGAYGRPPLPSSIYAPLAPGFGAPVLLPRVRRDGILQCTDRTLYPVRHPRLALEIQYRGRTHLSAVRSARR
jgi:hypothetical protein